MPGSKEHPRGKRLLNIIYLHVQKARFNPLIQTHPECLSSGNNLSMQIRKNPDVESLQDISGLHGRRSFPNLF